jgi:nitrite reductase/ring-hydroxylating ferredoxin subunit
MQSKPTPPPLWREEFSVFKNDERYVSRRQLTKFLTLTSLAMFVGNVWILIRAKLQGKAPELPTMTVARVGEIPVGGVKLFEYPHVGEQCILVRVDEEAYVAYSQKCTHLSCAVYYSQKSKDLVCPCHEGHFSIRDGSVLQGPPTRPLPSVTLERRGHELVAIGMANTGAE